MLALARPPIPLPARHTLLLRWLIMPEEIKYRDAAHDDQDAQRYDEANERCIEGQYTHPHTTAHPPADEPSILGTWRVQRDSVLWDKESERFIFHLLFGVGGGSEGIRTGLAESTPRHCQKHFLLWKSVEITSTHVFVQFVHIWYIQDRFYASSPRVDNTPVHRSVLFCSFHESNHPTYAQHPKAHPGTAAQCRPWSSLPPSSSARSLPALARSPSSLPRSRHRRFRTGVGVLPHTPGMLGAPSTWVDLSKAFPLDRMAFRIGVAGEGAPIVGAGTT